MRLSSTSHLHTPAGLLSFLLLCVNIQCHTIGSFVSDDAKRILKGNYIYSGTQCIYNDCWGARWGGCGGLGILVLDFPLSLTLDTALLPVTLLVTLFHYTPRWSWTSNPSTNSQVVPRLIEAARRGDIAAARELIQKGADVNATDSFGTTSLMYAAGGTSVELVRLLLDAKADIGMQESYAGRTALFLARLPQTVRLLIDRGADVNAVDRYGSTALFRAAEMQANFLEDGLEIMRILLVNGADVNARNTHGETALMYVATVEAARVLIAGGADINAKDRQGYSVLGHFKNQNIIDRANGRTSSAGVMMDYFRVIGARE